MTVDRPNRPTLTSQAKRLLPGPVKTVLRRGVIDRVAVRRALVPTGPLEATFAAALRHVLAHRPDGDLGAYVEFGVCRGSSMVCMANASRRVGVPDLRLIGFDSFAGLPDGVEDEDDGHWHAGQFRSSETAARRKMRRAGVEFERVVLVKGWFEETATPELAATLDLERVAVAMIDCDAYSSAAAGLSFIAPLLGKRAVLIFDDWHSGGLASRGQGERRAYEELLERQRDLREVERLPPYSSNAQVIVVERDAP